MNSLWSGERFVLAFTAKGLQKFGYTCHAISRLPLVSQLHISQSCYVCLQLLEPPKDENKCINGQLNSPSYNSDRRAKSEKGYRANIMLLSRTSSHFIGQRAGYTQCS